MVIVVMVVTVVIGKNPCDVQPCHQPHKWRVVDPAPSEASCEGALPACSQRLRHLVRMCRRRRRAVMRVRPPPRSSWPPEVRSSAI